MKAKKVCICVEGGGTRRPLRTACRRGFDTFLRRAGLADHMPRIVACGSRAQAYDRFCTATDQQTADFVCLLVDSEGPVTAATPWAHLAPHGRPEGVSTTRAETRSRCCESSTRRRSSMPVPTPAGS